MINLELIKDLAQKLPGAEMSTSYGTPSVKARKKLILRLHQKEDAIVMMVDTVEEQQALIESDPMTFYITDHYQGYAAVLIRPTIDPEVFFDLMEKAWRRIAKKLDIATYDANNLA